MLLAEPSDRRLMSDSWRALRRAVACGSSGAGPWLILDDPLVEGGAKGRGMRISLAAPCRRHAGHAYNEKVTRIEVAVGNRLPRISVRGPSRGCADAFPGVFSRS